MADEEARARRAPAPPPRQPSRPPDPRPRTHLPDPSPISPVNLPVSPVNLPAPPRLIRPSEHLALVEWSERRPVHPLCPTVMVIQGPRPTLPPPPPVHRHVAPPQPRMQAPVPQPVMRLPQQRREIQNQTKEQSSMNISKESLVTIIDEITIPASASSTGTKLGARKENVEYIVIPDARQTDVSDMFSYQDTNSLEEDQIKFNNKFNSIEEDIKTMKSDIKSIKDDVTTIKDTLNTILNNQVIMHTAIEQNITKVTELQVTNEEFITKAIREKQNKSVGIKTIKDIKELEEFEKNLMQPDFKQELKTKLSVICIKGVGNGTTSAYALVDVIFERQFFKLCSWTGNSRSPDETNGKICFKSFTKTIGFFFDVIHQHDSSFHLNDCHKFFKTILRNSDQRCKIKPLRASTKKCRGKKVTGDKKTPSDNEIPPELEQLLIYKEMDGPLKEIEVADITEVLK